MTIVVVGDVMCDVLAHVDDPLALGSDTAARVHLRPGGAGANTAAWLGHLGVPVVMAGRVGDDPLGRDAAAALARHGVDVRLEVAPGETTGVCIVLVHRDGERTMLPDAGANAGLAERHLPADAFAAGGHLHLSGYTLLNPDTRAAGAAALALARGRGMTTSLDPASAAPLARMGGDAFLALTRGVDAVLVTPDEAEVLAGTRDPGEAAGRLLATYGEVVVKRGARGASWFARDGEPVHVPAALPPGPLVDATGAGDAFAAGWLAGRRRGLPPADALAEACRCGAVAVTLSGARPEGSAGPGNRS